MIFNTAKPAPKKKFIALLGFMGVGKTSVGRGLSKKLNFFHIDTDNEIEKTKNMKIKNIFDFYGENYFRELEQEVILKIINNSANSVLSLGGGSFLNIKIREMIKKNCISVWLDANIDVIFNRIENSKNIRPVFSRINNKEDLEVLLNKRNLIYKEADIRVKTGDFTKNRLVNMIFSKLKSMEQDDKIN